MNFTISIIYLLQNIYLYPDNTLPCHEVMCVDIYVLCYLSKITGFKIFLKAADFTYSHHRFTFLFQEFNLLLGSLQKITKLQKFVPVSCRSCMSNEECQNSWRNKQCVTSDQPANKVKTSSSGSSKKGCSAFTKQEQGQMEVG